jgi:hypothetical protein
VDDQRHPLLGPTRKDPKTEAFLRDAHTNIRKHPVRAACQSVSAQAA